MIGRHQYPAGGPTTKPLNEGVSGVVNAATIIAIKVYSTAVNSMGPYYLLGTLTSSAGGIFPDPGLPPGIGTQPGTNTAGIQAPTVAPSIGAVASTPAWPAGTYQIAYSLVTAIGESTLSPSSAYVASGTTELQFNNGTAIPSSANTGYLTLTLQVPRLEDWVVSRYAILVSSNNVEPACTIYIDSVSAVGLLDSTNQGSRNSANSDIWLTGGHEFIVQFTSADPGAHATFSVYGTKTS